VQAKDKQDYVAGGPDDVSQAWLISSGGRLYDNWFVSLGAQGPKATHPVWPASNTSLAGEVTWRCKSCHGWDYLGRDGQYRTGPNATGIVGLQRAKGRDPALLMAIMGNATHQMTDDILPPHAKYRIALFLSRGQHDATKIVLANGRIKGDIGLGKPIFQSVCASCHGFDGRARKLGVSSSLSDSGYTGDALYIGTKANSGPIEVLHKIRNGHPGAIMVSMRAFPLDVAANLLAYAQTLPTK
jgi:cytochrome c2